MPRFFYPFHTDKTPENYHFAQCYGAYNGQNESLGVSLGKGKKRTDGCPMVQGNRPRGTSVCGKIPDGG